MARSRHGHGAGPEAKVELQLIKVGEDRYQVSATNRNSRYPFKNNRIGTIAKQGNGVWRHSSAHNPAAGPIYGDDRTPVNAARSCYKSHRTWIGY